MPFLEAAQLSYNVREAENKTRVYKFHSSIDKLSEVASPQFNNLCHGSESIQRSHDVSKSLTLVSISPSFVRR